MNCQTKQLFAANPSNPGYEIAPYVQSASPLAGDIFGNRLEGSEQGFSDSLNSDGLVVLTKKKSIFDIFGKDVSTAIGRPNSESLAELCRNAPQGFSALVPEDVVIDLLPAIRVVEDVEWKGDCYKHSHWPNDTGDDYYKPYRESLTLTNVQSGATITVSLDSAAEIGNTHDSSTSLDTCNAAQLP